VLVEDGDPDALIAAPNAGYTRALVAAVPGLRAERRRAACRA
jgi:ABC-type glutathione transport system ATPase component